jgi:hypothetical protein
VRDRAGYGLDLTFDETKVLRETFLDLAMDFHCIEIARVKRRGIFDERTGTKK